MHDPLNLPDHDLDPPETPHVSDAETADWLERDGNLYFAVRRDAPTLRVLGPLDRTHATCSPDLMTVGGKVVAYADEIFDIVVAAAMGRLDRHRAADVRVRIEAVVPELVMREREDKP